MDSIYLYVLGELLGQKRRRAVSKPRHRTASLRSDIFTRRASCDCGRLSCVEDIAPGLQTKPASKHLLRDTNAEHIAKHSLSKHSSVRAQRARAVASIPGCRPFHGVRGQVLFPYQVGSIPCAARPRKRAVKRKLRNLHYLPRTRTRDSEDI